MTSIGLDKVCFILGRSPSTIYRMMKYGEFPRPLPREHNKILSQWDVEDIRIWVNATINGLNKRYLIIEKGGVEQDPEESNNYNYDKITNKVTNLLKEGIA